MRTAKHKAHHSFRSPGGAPASLNAPTTAATQNQTPLAVLQAAP
ncbi:hypothetical protein FHS56_001400 [Thermonema lapsum]|uniref:Uncharacterized protein n=1 Tax=Thermonema lapsum TaxID=28195 RepID=A0A846MRK1_9BACT|nr:hypothetical protein [Thermonema lapsum]NIK73887.1 hypothetical protein [Thermonema lapsum]